MGQMYCSGKREIKNNRVCFFHNTTRTHRWREGGMERGRAGWEKKLLTLEEFLLLSNEITRISRSDSSLAFTALPTNGRVKLCCVIDF